jgi:hypothetical protein
MEKNKMKPEEMKKTVEIYLNSYNSFDIDSMLSVIHSDIHFTNITNGKVTAVASGIEELRQLAEQSKSLFSSRNQQMSNFQAMGNQAFIDVDYIGVIAADPPNGMKEGTTLRIKGKTEFGFRDGKIYKITDIS